MEQEIKTTQMDENVIRIGNKPIEAYVKASLRQASLNENFIIKSRGKKILTAIIVSEMLVKNKRYLSDTHSIKKIEIDTEKIVRKEDKKTILLSTISITIGKI